MAVIIGSARRDENGRYSGGSSTVNASIEISTQEWYQHSKGWYVIRPKDPVVAEKIAKNMEAACESKYIGYDQGQNYTLYQAVKPLGYDISKLKTYCETDCARLVRVCVLYAGINAPDFYTGNMKDALINTGAFTLFTSSDYCNSSKKLRRGDILVTRSKGHTVVVLSNGSEAGSVATSTTTSSTPSVLKLGSKGFPVKELQQNLIKLGYSCGSAGADGDFGNSTLAAVKKFQKDKGLECDGIVGSATQAKIKECLDTLNKPTTSKPSTNTSTSTTASSKYNEKILKGQKWLNANYGDKLIKYCGGKLVENGIYDAKTRAAIVCVWKDLMNRKYGTNLTPSNSNFLSSCEAAAKNAAIELGDSGTFVYLAQILLVAEGIYNGSMDGSYGSSMKSAMITYQKKVFPNAPKEWDGIGGTKFWMKIMN